MTFNDDDKEILLGAMGWMTRVLRDGEQKPPADAQGPEGLAPEIDRAFGNLKNAIQAIEMRKRG